MSDSAPSAVRLDERALHPGSGNLLAFSGGPDSTCLLHLLLARGMGDRLRVVHVDHGLDAGSAERAERARALAHRLGAECRIERLDPVDVAGGDGPEAAARAARYACLGALMQPGDHLLTAHHADDQAETVLLRLLRGAGPTGLAAMAPVRPLPPGLLARPLLDVDRDAIKGYLAHHGIEPIDDPTNAAVAADRNYLRHRVLPAIGRRWPGYRATLLRAARWQREAADALDARARSDWRATWLHAASGEALLSLPAWLALSPQRAFAVVRHWCGLHDLPEPPPSSLRDFRRQCRAAGGDRQPLLDWPAAQLRAHRGGLWLDRKPLADASWAMEWRPPRPVPLPAGGTLVLNGPLPPGIDRPVLLGPAPAGARLRLSRHGPSRPVVELMREAGIPPWRRPALPALQIGDRLVAVGPDWQDAEFAERLRAAGAELQWRGRPRGLLPSGRIDPDSRP